MQKGVTKHKLVRMTARVWKDDFDLIKSEFPDNYNAQIRRIIGAWCAAWRLGHEQTKPEEQ